MLPPWYQPLILPHPVGLERLSDRLKSKIVKRQNVVKTGAWKVA